ncbi:MAG: sensor histidine kinase [Lachnospiraceae bacterium]
MSGVFIYLLAGNTTCYVLEFILAYTFCAGFSVRKVTRRRLVCLILSFSLLSSFLITILTSSQIQENGYFYSSLLIVALLIMINVIQALVMTAAFQKLSRAFCFLVVTFISAASDMGSLITEYLEVYRNWLEWSANNYWLRYLIRIPFLTITYTLLYVVIYLFRRSRGTTKVNVLMNQPGGYILIGMVITLLKMISIRISSDALVRYGKDRHSSIYLMLFSVIIVLVILLAYAYYVKLNEKEMELMIGQQKAYLKRLEGVQRKLRAVNHDYKNIAAGLYLSAEAGDMEAVKEYINNQLLRIDEEIQEEILQTNQLIQIESIELKSLMLTKIALAGSKNVLFQLEISGSPGDINLPIKDLLRCLGILLDNAIEGAEEAADKVVKVLIVKEQNTITIHIKNRFDGEVSLNQIFNPGCSTKGEGRGIGLYTLQETLRKYPNTLLETKLKDGWFIQIIKIR